MTRILSGAAVLAFAFVAALSPALVEKRVALAQTYLKLPPTTKSVSVELTYTDGSVSETKTFRR